MNNRLAIQEYIDSPAICEFDSDQLLIDSWLREAKPGTAKAYRNALRKLRAFTSAGIRELRLSDLQDWRDQLEGEPATVKQAISAIKSLLSFAAKMGYTRFNVGSAIRTPKVPDKTAEKLIEESAILDLFSELRAELRKAKRPDPRAYLICRLAYYSGARASELAGLKWKHVREHSGSLIIDIHSQKTGIDVSVKLKDTISAELRAFRPAEPRLK